MADRHDILITGVGVLSPIGIGCDAFWSALVAGRSGVRPLAMFDTSALSVRFGGQVVDFDPRLYVRPRKSLKLMSRDIQLGFAAAELALADAGISAGSVAPERFGVVFGGDMIYAEPEDLESTYRRSVERGGFSFPVWAEAIQEELHPLWLLKHLPNMTASHIAIAHDARGPNNSIVLAEVSSLLAVSEAAAVIGRGWADVMLCGGTGSRVHPTAIVSRGESRLSHRLDDCRRASRPFDRDRDGMVNGEGAGVFVLESRCHAEARGARPRGRVLGAASRCDPRARAHGFDGSSVRQAIRGVLAAARLQAEEVGHVNAHGLSTIDMDRAEAAAIVAELGAVPVTAPKASFGNLGAGSGAVELAASILGIGRGLVPQTLNYEAADPACPVNVVHDEPLAGRPPTVLALNACSMGQAVAVAVTVDD